MADLSVRALTVEYVSDGYSVRALDGMSFEASKGELIVVLGPSGSGKTSLLSCLAGILRPTSGTIEVDGADVAGLSADDLVSYRRTKVGIVFQAFNLIPSASARENVAAPLLIAGRRHGESLARADELLRTVHLEDRGRHKPGKLSGGQQQRVALARALAMDPPMLLADEPTANLDYINAESIVSLLRELRSRGRLIIVSTHDQRLVPIADHVIRMVSDPSADGGPPQRIAYARGDTIFEQGTRGDLIYVIASGEVEILRTLADGTASHLATLGAHEYFGELGPLLGFPRSATARARTDVELVAYGVRDFREQVLGQIEAGASANGKRPRRSRAAKSTRRPAPARSRGRAPVKAPAKRTPRAKTARR